MVGDLWAPAVSPPVPGDVFMVVEIPSGLPTTANLAAPVTAVSLAAPATVAVLSRPSTGVALDA